MDIYQHFHKDERIFVEQVLDWIQQVDQQYTPYLTSFLNPRELFIASSIINHHGGFDFESYGGFEGAEQKRIIIYPDYFQAKEEDFELSLFEINYPKKFAELSHGQILGSILGTGLSRSNLGDIISSENRWQFIIDKKMKQFIRLNLDKIGRISVQLEEKNLEEIIEKEDNWQKEELIVASLRIDLVLARALNLSRNRAKELIQDKKIKINWSEINRPDIELNEQDIISIRGFGRIQMYEQLAKTRKDNLVIEIGIINRKS
ncbi:MAG: YlmH/Sll1252 family protein [Atopostipes suicloacalis]|nr:YlmH/Sll1252 family protein [Atopostipes suicloacalis]